MESIIYPLLGGVIIGVSATMMLYFNGKITGISGIVGGSLGKFSQLNYWRYQFILGLVVGGLFMRTFFPEFFNYELSFGVMEVIAAGLLVGIGTSMGNGCTSGHGVCGIPRLSARSIVATLNFMLVAMITVWIKGVL